MNTQTYIDIHYNFGLVVLSLVVALIAAYTALNFLRRFDKPEHDHSQSWLLAGGTALGTGIWTMHFIGMLAIKTDIQIVYDTSSTALSLIIAVASCIVGFGIITRFRQISYLFLSGIIIGLGVSTMHYMGMFAMRFSGEMHFNSILVTLSVLIAISAATTALLMPRLLRRFFSERSLLIDFVAAAIMGLAIAGMHYTGMAATNFTAVEGMEIIATGFDLHEPILAAAVTTAGGVLLLFILISSLAEQRFSSKLEHEKNLHKASDERLQKIIDEVADCILAIDKKGLIRMFNPAAERLFGYSNAEVIGKNISMLMPEPYHSQHDTYIADYLRSGKGKIIGIGPREVEGLSKDGRSLPLELAVNDVDFRGERQFIGILRDLAERNKAQAQLFYQANYDSLTGLFNRYLLSNRFEHAIAQARRYHSNMALLFIDLDGFKQVNDTLGHDAGDSLLVRVADRLKQNTRECDSAARHGGDEFVILLETMSKADDATIVAAKLIKTLAASYSIKGREVSISVSIGIALYPRDGEDPESLIQSADKAMYAAKNAGKNQYHLASEPAEESNKLQKLERRPQKK